MTTRSRPAETGDPTREGELFRVHRNRCGQQLQAVCELWTYGAGWEIRLVFSDGHLQRSQVCGSMDEAFGAGDAWRASLVERGWT